MLYFYHTEEMIITVTQFETPLGQMFAGATEEGICLLGFADEEKLESEVKGLPNKFNVEIIQGESKYFAPLLKQLNEYFEGKRKEFDLPLILLGTDFQKDVWNELLRIPFGTTRSYKQQSIALNKLDAIRAVAGANGTNRIAIIIPCHRVIGENGSLTGYGGGLWRKKWLLDLESGQLPLNTL